ncbi:MAG: extracellular solute-binding protein [Lachnospiraceae bacterium]|nr:extracellular solute-binding protein [Lachnospiraceae bacterium]
MKKRLSILWIFILAALSLCGCSDDNHGLSRDNPTTISVWHSYSGHTASQFDELVTEFNNTIGREKGVIITAQSMSSTNNLEEALWNSASEKIGSAKMPNIFQCYPDTALSLESKVDLIDFNEYITEDEKLTYVRQFLDSGYIGSDNAWKIFPVAKSTEVLMLNKTDWDKFAEETAAEPDSLLTWEGLAQTAQDYYEWSGGKAFFGRESFANYPILGSSQLGHELFKVSGNGITLDFEQSVMKKVWDHFYVPYINGYYSQIGKSRCDDVRIGEIIALVCSSSDAAYFPKEVVLSDGTTYPIECMVLPLPNFKDTAPYAALLGAGMAVTKSTEAEEYASVLFLKWFTECEQNLRFSACSGYMPVSLEAVKADIMSAYLEEHSADAVIRDTIMTSLSQTEKYIMYAPTGFAGGSQAKDILDRTMPALAIADRTAIENGAPHDEYLSDTHFKEWYAATLSELKQYFNQEAYLLE